MDFVSSPSYISTIGGGSERSLLKSSRSLITDYSLEQTLQRKSYFLQGILIMFTYFLFA